MNIKDVLVGVGIAWLTLTPEGRAVRDKALKELTEKYMLPKTDVKSTDKSGAYPGHMSGISDEKRG